MALYLGSGEKIKISIDDLICNLNFLTIMPVIEGIQLLTSDGCVLRDFYGLYLTAERSE